MIKVKNPILQETIEWVEVIVVAFFVALVIRAYVVENTRVSGSSMEPTLHGSGTVFVSGQEMKRNHADKLLINKFIYYFKKPQRGDIVVFPHDKEKSYIKRIVGLPGETVNIKDGKVYINDVELKEDYIKEKMIATGDITYPFPVPANSYFVMGDNRNNSNDSRYQDVGPIEKSRIKGKAVLRIWPFSEFGTVK